MNTTSPLQLKEKPDKPPGFWSATKGEFESTWRLLESSISQKGGFPLEIMGQLRTSGWFLEQVADIMVHGGYLPSVDEKQALEAGVDLITQGQLKRVLSYYASSVSVFETAYHLAPIPFPIPFLKQKANDYMLIPGPPKPMALGDIAELLPTDLLCQGNFLEVIAWHLREEKVEPRWYLIGKVPIERSRNVEPANMPALIPDGERMVTATELIYATVIHNYVRRTPLFLDHAVVTSSRTKNHAASVVDFRDQPGWKRLNHRVFDAHNLVVTVSCIDPAN